MLIIFYILQVTRLLAVIYLLSTFGAPFPSLVSDKLVASSWAAFFHQVSIGTGQHHKYLSILNERLDLCSSGNSEVCFCFSSSFSSFVGYCMLL